MNTPVHSPNKSTLHPLVIAAAVAVMLFCAVGTAALMGWLPSSTGSNNARQEAALAAAREDKPAAVAHNDKPARGSASSHAEPVRHKPAPAPERSVCNNCGVIENVREINTRAEGSGVGAAGGAVLGGLLGNQVGGGHGRQLATVAGAIGGAVAGNQIEGNIKSTRSYDITVRLDNGATRTIHQSAAPAWGVGDQVRIVDGVIRSDG